MWPDILSDQKSRIGGEGEVKSSFSKKSFFSYKLKIKNQIQTNHRDAERFNRKTKYKKE